MVVGGGGGSLLSKMTMIWRHWNALCANKVQPQNIRHGVHVDRKILELENELGVHSARISPVLHLL
jgi:hypothetical protein